MGVEQAWGGFRIAARLLQVLAAARVLVIAAWDGTNSMFCSLEIV